MNAETLRQAALDYHEFPVPGKLSVEITTPANTQTELSLAYSPGVAEPCREIYKDPQTAHRYTGKGNLVAVISNGSAILGLGNLGALASKPVMEGKSLLFKRFSGINSVDIEVDQSNTDDFIKSVKAISCTFGGINLEDIKAPDCFEIEERLIAECDIPVFHDDQHGTAIVTVAALLNALELQKKTLDVCKVVCLGAGAAATAICKLMYEFGLKKTHLTVLDSRGVIYKGRDNVNKYKQQFAIETQERTLTDAIKNADVFIGVSGPNLLNAEQLLSMNKDCVVFACSNPTPEITPELVHATRSDVIMATGRSDYPNQVNNVLCFPFLFRGALDVRAREINLEMKKAAVHVLRDITKLCVPKSVSDNYGGVELQFGKDYIVPKPTDPRLLGAMSDAVAKAAIQSGVARLPYPSHYPLESLKDCVVMKNKS